MKCAVTILFLSASLSTAADDAESKKLLKNLEGSYKITSAEIRGQVVSTDGDFLKVVFEKVSLKGDKFTMISKNKYGQETEVTGTIAVDAAKKPVHVDFNFKMSDQTQSASGIIAIDGETIKICINDPADKKRPTEFKTTEDNKYMLITLKKIKE
jgi:uncharacterized protein (TIGR03067 family)